MRGKCPDWTSPSMPVQVYERMIKTWHDNLKSTLNYEMINYNEITEKLTKNSAIPGLKDYMRTVIANCVVCNNLTVESVMKELVSKYKTTKLEKDNEVIKTVEKLDLYPDFNPEKA